MPVFSLGFISGRYDEDTDTQGTLGSLGGPAKAQNTNTYMGYCPVILYVSAYVCTRVCHSTCAEVRLRIVRVGSRLPHYGVPRIELVSSGLAAKAFTCGDISQTLISLILNIYYPT